MERDGLRPGRPRRPGFDLRPRVRTAAPTGHDRRAGGRARAPLLGSKGEALAAETGAAEPDNAIATNNRTVAAELRRAGLLPAQAQALAQARVFGNPAGDYGTGISAAVQDNGLKSPDGQTDPRLGLLFLSTMSQPYVEGEPLAVPAGEARQALGAHLRHTDAALMSRSSHLYAMVSSDDPFQYLGGLAAAAKVAGNTRGVAVTGAGAAPADVAEVCASARLTA